MAVLISAAGVELKPEMKLDGVNLLPYLSGEKTGVPHDALYWRFGNQMGVRSGDFKLVRYDATADGKSGGARGVNGPRLYNLAKDIHEDQDLSATMPEKLKELQAKWDTWNQGNVKPAWGAEGKGAKGGEKKGKKKADQD